MCIGDGKTKDKKEFHQLTRKKHYEQGFMVSSKNVLSLDRNIIKSFLVVALKKPLALLQSLYVLSSSHRIHMSKKLILFLFLSHQNLEQI